MSDGKGHRGEARMGTKQKTTEEWEKCNKNNEKIAQSAKKERNYMKKWIGMLAVSAMAAGILAGCGNTAPAPAAPAAPAAAEAPAAEEKKEAEAPAAPAADEKVDGTVATDGSTSMEKVIGALGEAFEQNNSGVTFTYNPTGSGTGIQAVEEGRCDIGLSSRSLKDEEKAKGLAETVIALDGIAIIVNPANKVEDLTMDTVAKIYKGEITDWKDAGGEAGEIVLIGREAGSGTRDGFESITGTKDACQYRQELTSTGDVITTVAGNPNAIGYASLASVKDSVKAIAVDGVAPSEGTVKDGSYKVQRPFVLVTKDGQALSAAAQKFYDYATSADSAEVITAAGVVPAN